MLTVYSLEEAKKKTDNGKICKIVKGAWKYLGKNYWNWDEHLHILRILSCHVKMMRYTASQLSYQSGYADFKDDD